MKPTAHSTMPWKRSYPGPELVRQVLPAWAMRRADLAPRERFVMEGCAPMPGRLINANTYYITQNIVLIDLI